MHLENKWVSRNLPGFVLDTVSRFSWLATVKTASGRVIIIGNESIEEETRMIRVMEKLL